MIPPPAMSLSASGITSRMSPPARSIPPGRRPPCGPISWRRSPLPRTAFLPNGTPAAATISISPIIPPTTSTSSMGAISLPISAAWWMNYSISTSAAAARSTPSLHSTAMAPPSPAGDFPSGAPLPWPITATRRWAFCATTMGMTSSLIPPRYSAASPPLIRVRRLPSAAAERMSAPSAPGSTASAAIIRPFPPSAPPAAIPTMPKCSVRCGPSSASSI